MPRTHPKRRPPSPPLPAADRKLLEVELGPWAGVRIAQGGRRDALLGRVEVLRLSLDGTSLEARVRGNRPLPYLVEVTAADPEPRARCTCSREPAGPCRHAVAALEALRFPRPAATKRDRRRRGPSGRRASGVGRVLQHGQAAPGFVLIGGAETSLGRDERIALVREEEILARRQRARRRRDHVRILPDASGALLLEVGRRGGEEPHRVFFRGEGESGARCNCDDFAENELGTCVHVERARAWWRRHRGALANACDPPLAIWCRPRVWLEQAPDALAEIRVETPAPDGRAALDRYFDEEGWLRPAAAGRRPAAWAGRAVAAARALARRRGWRLDLDPEVRQRLGHEARAAALAWRRAALDRDPGGWIALESAIGLTLHEYQREGVRFLTRTGRTFLADDMGLGKTIQAIVAALALGRAAGAARTLVVCPASLKHQWSGEVSRTCSAAAVVVEGPPARRHAAYAAWRAGFLIVNYELVLRDLTEIRASRPDLVVLDEAQRIKNWSTVTARAVKRLDSPHAFVLTGTPLENRLAELHSLVEFLHPRALGPRWRLGPFHSVTESRGRVIAYEGLAVLRRRLAGFFLRRERREVMDQLPPRTDNTFWTGMTPAQRRPYRKHSVRAAALAAKNEPLGPAEIRALFRALTAMRILCNAHAQYAWHDYEPLVGRARAPGDLDLRLLHSPKLEEFARVLDDLLDSSEDKVVVFSQWERMLRLAQLAARGALERRDLTSGLFHGGLTSRARSAMLDAFREEAEFRVLFSTDAGGQGLNLQHASIVIQLEVPWNPAVLEQRVGRVHRLGQRRSVQVLHFVTRGAIEERVRKVVEDKRALFDGLLVDDADRVALDSSVSSGFLGRVRQLLQEEGAGDA